MLLPLIKVNQGILFLDRLVATVHISLHCVDFTASTQTELACMQRQWKEKKTLNILFKYIHSQQTQKLDLQSENRLESSNLTIQNTKIRQSQKIYTKEK